MVRRSFRIGLRLGLFIGLGFALVKTVQSRRASSAPPPPEPWQPIVDTPRPAPTPRTGSAGTRPVDEVGEQILEPSAPEATRAPPARPAPRPAPVPVTAGVEEDLLIEDAELAGIDSALDVIPDDSPAPAAGQKAAAKRAPAAKKAATSATKAKKAAKKAAAPVPGWVEATGGTCPPTHPIKGKLASRLFHLPGMFAYDRTRPDRCFRDAEAAVAEGFTQAKR